MEDLHLGNFAIDQLSKRSNQPALQDAVEVANGEVESVMPIDDNGVEPQQTWSIQAEDSAVNEADDYQDSDDEYGFADDEEEASLN